MDQMFGSIYWDVATTVPGTTYYIVVDNGSSADACISGSLDNPYPDGNLYANARLYSLSRLRLYI